MPIFGKSKGGSVRRSLGMLNATGDVVQRKPEEFHAEFRWQITPNSDKVL